MTQATPLLFLLAALPAQVEAVFKRSFAVGRAFGVVRIAVDRHWMEVATFRTEADYRDGRHPEEVRFATSEEDVQRRDFTVNGLLWNPHDDEIVDHVGGRDDVRQRCIRAIGDADERFREDALRLIRAVRFGSWLDFHLDEQTQAAVRRQAAGLTAISAERIRDELLKITTRPSTWHRAMAVRSIPTASSPRVGQASTTPGRSRRAAMDASLWKWPPNPRW